MSRFVIGLLTVVFLSSCVFKEAQPLKHENKRKKSLDKKEKAVDSKAVQPLKHKMTPKELLVKMDKAVDPKDAAKKWKTLIVEMQMRIPMQQHKISMRVIYKFPDKSKGIAKITGAPTVIQVFNGKQAWTETVGLGIQMKSGIQLAFAKFECRKSNPVLQPDEVYKKITLDPYLYKIGKFTCYKLICYLPEELKLEPSQIFVDNKEFLIRRSIENQLTDLGVIPVSIDSLNYKVMSGVKIATIVKTNLMGIEMVGEISSLKPDATIADSEFELPKEK